MPNESTILTTIKTKLGAKWFHGNLNVTDIDGNIQILSGEVVASGLTAYLGSNSVSGTHIQDGAISTVKIALGAVDGTIVAAGAIKNINIADDAITSPKIFAGAIVAGLLATDSVITSNIIAGAITTNKIEVGAIDTDRLAANSITSPKIAANEIKTINLDAGAITTVKLAALAVTADKIDVNAITAEKIAVGALTADKIGSGIITSKIITLSASTSDCYIASGKTDFNDMTSGWIIGRDYSDSNRAKISIGDANNFFRWTGTILEIKGIIHIVGGIGISNFSDAGGLVLKDYVNLATGEVINKTADYISESSTKKWAGESGANITGNHTAANTNYVGSAPASTISGWRYGGTTYIHGGNIYTGTVTANQISATAIDGKTITGAIIKTDSYSYPKVKLDSYGITMDNRYSTSVFQIKYAGTLKGQIYTDGGTLWLYAASGVNLKLYAGGNILIAKNMMPDSSGRNLGTSSYYFGNFYANSSYITNRYWRNATSKYMLWNSSHYQVEMNSGLYVGGNLSKATGNFMIDHPLKPYTHVLQHSFVESPEMMNIYKGNAWIQNGKCEIKMPDWFIALNGKNQDDYSYCLTNIGKRNILWVEKEMNDNGEVVFAAEEDGKFSYIIYAVRHDPYAENHRIKVEEKKDKKYYLYPEYYKSKK